jgi:uncharacterized protein involved in exopolysaccharide biosynthesis
MNAPQLPESTPNHATSPSQSGDVSLIDWLFALKKRKKLVLGIPALFALCAALVVASMSDIYRASTKILPRENPQSNAAVMLNQLGSMAGPAGGLSIQIPVDPSGKIPIDLYISMLKSRRVADNLIRRFDLQKIYGSGPEGTRMALARNTTIRPGREGLLSIEVEDRSPKRAAEIANAYVDELFEVVKDMGLPQTSHLRLHVEKHLRSAREKLAIARAAMLKVPPGTSTTAIDSNTRTTVEKVARLGALIFAKEVQLSGMQAFATVSSPEHIRAQQELNAMRSEFARFGDTSAAGQRAGAGSESQADLAGINALHDVKYYQTLSESLAKQYESARDEEANDFSIIRVLERAIEPEAAVKPQRPTIIISATLSGLFVALFWVLFVDVLGLGRRFNPQGNK